MKKIIYILTFCACQFFCQAQNNISSFEDRIYCGFTEDGIICTSFDGGQSWEETDFNKEYYGFYPRITFIAASAGDRSVAVTGTDPEGHPHLFVSSKGKVWAERELSWLSHGSPVFLSATPLSLEYEAPSDQFLLHCSDSTTLLLPPCSHCNQLLPTAVLVNYAVELRSY